MEMKRISEKTIIFDGIRFTRAKGRKYYRNTTVGKDLHRYIYEYYKGKIKEGYAIHHIDRNTENNNIDNLMQISKSDHAKKHSRNLSPERIGQRKNNCDRIRPLTKAWHASPEGKAWHKKHFEDFKDVLHVERDFICEECGKRFKSIQVNSKFCSNSCKSKHRRKSGVDNVERVCEKCGKVFATNKYSRVRFCSRRCAKLK